MKQTDIINHINCYFWLSGHCKQDRTYCEHCTIGKCRRVYKDYNSCYYCLSLRYCLFDVDRNNF